MRPRLVYPQMHPQMGWILNHIATVKIKKADVLPKGTQLKMLFYLEGNQKAVFKPMRYERDHVIDGNAWDGYDRHNAEIAAFHLGSGRTFKIVAFSQTTRLIKNFFRSSAEFPTSSFGNWSSNRSN